MHRGYAAFWRRFKDHSFWKERREFSRAEAWIDLFSDAQHSEEPQDVLLGLQIIPCYYGQSIKSLDTWGDRWNWSKSKVFRFFELLKQLKMIDVKSETVTTRITICNYAKYDPKRNTSETQAKRVRNACETGLRLTEVLPLNVPPLLSPLASPLSSPPLTPPLKNDKNDIHTVAGGDGESDLFGIPIAEEHHAKGNGELPKKKEQKFVRDNPPTREEVVAYWVKNGFSENDGHWFYKYMDEGGWTDGNGKVVRNWRQKALVNMKFERRKNESL